MHKKPERGQRTKTNSETRRDDINAAYNATKKKKKKASGSKSTIGSAIGGSAGW